MVGGTSPEGEADASPRPAREVVQQIRFCRATDGTELAWSVIGSGPTLVKTGNWMTHLEMDLESFDLATSLARPRSTPQRGPL